MSFINKFKLGLGAAKLILKTHAPEILLAIGLGSGIATVVTACKQTTKVNDIVDDANDEIAEADDALVHEKRTDDGEVYTQEIHDKDIRLIKAHTAGKLARNFAVPFGLGVTSFTCILAAFRILHKRNVALSAAFNGVSAAFAKYRESVRKELGEDVDNHFRYGTKLKYKKIIDEDGNVVDINEIKNDDALRESSFWDDPLCYDFNDTTSTEFRSEFHRRPENWQRLCDVQDWARTIVATRGHVFLNEILEQLGLAPCAAGQILGWRRRFDNDPEERFRCPDLSFGLQDIKNMVSDDGNPITGFDLQHLESYPLVFNCINIAHNPKMWERDRPYASLCSAHIKHRAW